MPLPDRQKQRREYLRKNAVAVSKSVSGNCLSSCLFFSTIIGGGCAVISLILTLTLPHRPSDKWVLPVLMGIFALIGITSGVGYRRLCRFTERAEQEQAAITYVPPVLPDTLPAEEILVRSSQEPAQEQSSVLLRAATENADTPAEELLRASTTRQE